MTTGKLCSLYPNKMAESSNLTLGAIGMGHGTQRIVPLVRYFCPWWAEEVQSKTKLGHLYQAQICHSWHSCCSTLSSTEQNQGSERQMGTEEQVYRKPQMKLGKGNPKSSRGKGHPSLCKPGWRSTRRPQWASQFSAELSERQRPCLEREKGNLKTQKVSETHCEREMETNFHPQEEPKKMLKNPSALLRPPLASFISVDRGPAHLLVKWQRSCEMWADPAANDGQPQEGKATEQKGKYKEDAAPSELKANLVHQKRKLSLGRVWREEEEGRNDVLIL